MPTKATKINLSAIKSRLTPLLQILFISYFGLLSSVQAETIRVAVASNFLQPARYLVQQFERLEAQGNNKVLIVSASSGKLYQQITHGAPYDLLLSADSEKPEQLVIKGLAYAQSKQTYAFGQLSVWMKDCQRPFSLEQLLDSRVKKIAIANPKLAPFGNASKKLLQNNNLWKKLQSKFVFPENISQVAQLAKIGVVDAAFIATSSKSKLNLMKTQCFGSFEHKDYPPITQQMVRLISRDKDYPLSKTLLTEQFARFILSIKGQNLIKNMGYIGKDSAKITPLK
jgi:molybdate transport system substrate-binding protein